MRLNQMETRPVKFDWLRQSDWFECSGLSGNRHVWPVRAFFGPESERFGCRFQRSDQLRQLIGDEIAIQAHDSRSFPEIDALESKFEIRTFDAAGRNLQCRYVFFGESANEHHRDMPVVTDGPLAGEACFIRLDRSVDLSPLFPRRPEGEKYSLATCLRCHEVVRGRPAGQ